MAYKFKNSYGGLSADTVYEADPATKMLTPYESGDAFLGAGNQFSQIQEADPTAFAGFGVGAPITRASQLEAVKTQLNNEQNQAFATTETANKRKSSTLQESIAAEQSSLSTGMSEYDALRKRMESLKLPNYTETYNAERTAAGIPDIEKDLLGVRSTRRELPYTERAATGNAGVTTESQLGAQTLQKDIPLEIREANAIDRLKLAQDFVNTAMNLKEKDATTARQAIADAINLVKGTIDMSQSSLTALRSQQEKQQTRSDAALKFRVDNGIQTPFFNVGGTIYDSGSLTGIPTEEAFAEQYGMTLEAAVAKGLVGAISGEAKDEKKLTLDLAGAYPDAGILTTDNFATASGKLKNSRIYQEKVRPPASAGSGSSGGVLGLSNQQIDNISPLVTQFQNSPIVQNYNTIGEGYKFATSIPNNTTNPADHQALIYAFAKAMDPGSVVREGEYATVQKYAQSWVQSYGKSVTQAIAGTGFLSEDAIKSIKSTIKSRFTASESSYKNLYDETSRRVNLVGSTDKGTQLLNNYGGAFSQVINEPAQPEPEPEPEQTKSFWGKVGGLLWGND